MTETDRERDELPVCSSKPGHYETQQLTDSLPGQRIHDYMIHDSQVDGPVSRGASPGELGNLETNSHPD